MSNRELMKRYPWYRTHERAVNTISSWLGIERSAVLKRLDKRVGSKLAMAYHKAFARAA